MDLLITIIDPALKGKDNIMHDCGSVRVLFYAPYRNAFCGQIQCEDGGTLETTPGIEVKYSLPSYSFVCRCV